MKDFLDQDITIGSHVAYHDYDRYYKGIVKSITDKGIAVVSYQGRPSVKHPENLIIIKAPVMDVFNQELKVGDRVAYRGTKDQASLSLGVIKSISGRVLMVLGDGRSRCAPCNPLNTVKAP